MQLSNTTGHSVFSSISASTSTSDGKKRIFVAWQDVTPQNGGILFRKSDDGGTTFGNTVTLDGSWNRAGSPAVASSINSPNVHVAWNDGTSGNNEIIFSTSTNNGDSFGSTINLSDNPNDSVLPSVAVSNNYVYVAWTDDRTGTSDIFLHRENNMQLDIKLILKLRGF